MLFRRRSTPLAILALLGSLALTACSGEQSALDPAGPQAQVLADFFWVMLIGSGVIWVSVIGLALYLTLLRPGPHSPSFSRRLLIFGAAFPAVTLVILLGYGLWLMPHLRATEGQLRVSVSGEQFWWRIAYEVPGMDDPIDSANEIRLPVGRPVEFILESPDVIHSFWIPVLGGKLDLIPGRTTRLVLEASETGTFRGVCAEYCGTSHALMAFSVQVMEGEAFDAWIEEEAQSADQPQTEMAEAGQDAFLNAGCGACHSVRGTEAQGVVGPDLTHFGSRHTVGAGILPNEPEAVERWIRETRQIKPGIKMPSFGMLAEEELTAIVAYLGSLE